MELEDLQNILSRAGDKNLPGLRQISWKETQSPDPFSEIKKRFIWIILFFIVTTLLFFPFLFNPEKRIFLIGLLYFILSIESVISLIGFLQIKGLEKKGLNIKQTLIQKIRRLRSIYRSYVFLNAGLYAVFAIAIEYDLQKNTNGYFEGFEKIALPFRILIYLLFILFQFLQKQWSFQKNYGLYLSSMVQLLNEASEE